MILSAVGGIRETLTEMMTLSADSNIPVGVRRILCETFKCHVCHTVPIKPPVIVNAARRFWDVSPVSIIGTVEKMSLPKCVLHAELRGGTTRQCSFVDLMTF